MNDNNKNSEPETKKSESDELMEDTIVFRREPEVRKNTPKPNPARPRNIPLDMQNTAKLQGGAVIRPLKPVQKQNFPQSRAPSQLPPQQQKPRQNQPMNRDSQNRVPQNQIAPQNRVPQNVVPQNSAPQKSSLTPVNRPENQIPPNQPQRQSESLPVTRSNPSEPRHNREFSDFEIDTEATQRRTPPRPPRDPAGMRDSASSAIMSALKAIIYIVCVIAVAVPLSIFIINTANDVFAFVKEEKLIEVEIPEYATIDEVGDILGEAGVIKYPWAFKLWSKLKEKNGTPEFIAGTYEVSTTLNYDYLRMKFKKSNVRTTIKITIPEGYTVDEIIDLFVEKGIGTREGFIDAINNYNFEYKFMENMTLSSDRTYRLEGYLFPDTYDFYSDATEVQAISKLLDNFNRKFVDEYYARCDELGMTVDEVVTLASMIEKEAKYADEFGDVSSVFHNRLKYSATTPYLQSDATIMYAIQYDSGMRKDVLTSEDTTYNSPYNTYTNKGLPPGPISNPGLNAISYALYPNNTKYFYFVSNSSGRMLFAETHEEHLKNINEARAN